MLQQRRNMQNEKTMDRTRKEIDNKNKIIINPQIIFHEKDFKDKKNIFILAKTWGAAKLFFDTTHLCKFRNVQINYISSWLQLEPNMNKINTIIIKLSRAFETEENKKTMGVCEGRNLTILDYNI